MKLGTSIFRSPVFLGRVCLNETRLKLFCNHFRLQSIDPSISRLTLGFGRQPAGEFPYPEPEPKLKPKPTHEKPCVQDRFHRKSSFLGSISLSNCLFTNAKVPNPQAMTTRMMMRLAKANSLITRFINSSFRRESLYNGKPDPRA